MSCLWQVAIEILKQEGRMCIQQRKHNYNEHYQVIRIQPHESSKTFEAGR